MLRSINKVYNAGIYIEQDTKNIIEYNTQEDELENDGYIREDEIQPKGMERKYNQIQSHKIENNWDANFRKKEETIWSHDNKSAKQYIIKNGRNDILEEKQQENRIHNDLTIEKMKKLQEEIQAKKINKVQDEIPKQKMKKIVELPNKNKKSKIKNEETKEDFNRPIRNQILFSEDEIEEE